MSGSDDLTKQALAMPRHERAALVAALLRTLENEPDDPSAELAWAEEVRRRVEELEAGAVKSVPWDEVREELVMMEKARGA